MSLKTKNWKKTNIKLNTPSFDTKTNWYIKSQKLVIPLLKEKNTTHAKKMIMKKKDMLLFPN